jgi:hypothetical protein
VTPTYLRVDLPRLPAQPAFCFSAIMLGRRRLRCTYGRAQEYLDLAIKVKLAASGSSERIVELYMRIAQPKETAPAWGS